MISHSRKPTSRPPSLARSNPPINAVATWNSALKYIPGCSLTLRSASGKLIFFFPANLETEIDSVGMFPEILIFLDGQTLVPGEGEEKEGTSSPGRASAFCH